MMDHPYEHGLFAECDAEQDVAIERAALDLTMLGQRVGLTVDDLMSVLRSGLSREGLVKYMIDRLMGRVH